MQIPYISPITDFSARSNIVFDFGEKLFKSMPGLILFFFVIGVGVGSA